MEFEIYKMLGVHENVLSSWRTVHDTWRFKAQNTRGIQKAMRLTG